MKRLFVSILLVAVACSAVAKEVTAERALSVGRSVLGIATRSGSVSVLWDSSALYATRGEDDAPTFYVVAAESGEGYVIISGDDALKPVLAYSMRYSAPSSEVLPPNFEGWLRYVDSAVRYAREHDVEADALTARLWSEEYKPVDAVMLNTARWSQLAPYNNYCPMDGTERSLTGCTQTALAIIMHHHRWPKRAQGVTQAYTTMTQGIAVEARDLNHAYDWDLMRDTYIEGEYSEAEGNAVAVLMADLGYAFMADFAALATGAMPDMLTLYNNFGYSPSSNIALRQNFSDTYWRALLRREIEAGRPLYYAGYTADWSGHAFVLDGVDANDYFHVNWGWGGAYDGFFLLDSLILDGLLFDTQQWTILGMHPVRDGEVDNWLYLTSSGMSIPSMEFSSGMPFNVDAICVGNYSQLNFSGEVRVGLCSKDGELKLWVTDAQHVELPPLYASNCESMPAIIECELVAGDRLCAFYRSSGSDKWYKMEPYTEGACSEVIVKYASIGDTTSISFDKASATLVVKYDNDVKSALYLDGEPVESGVSITTGRMVLDTSMLQHGACYTIYLERRGVESKSVQFTLNEL